MLLRERERVLDRGIARADHDDGLAGVLVRIVELVLHAVEVLARHAQLAQVALHADGEDQLARRRTSRRAFVFTSKAPSLPRIAVTSHP